MKNSFEEIQIFNKIAETLEIEFEVAAEFYRLVKTTDVSKLHLEMLSEAEIEN